MAISLCETSTDSNGRELLEHGTREFPVACYHDDLTEMDVPWHWHEELEVAVVTEGQAEFAVSGRCVILQTGEGCFLNQNVLHGAWKTCQDTCRLHSIVFHPRLIGAPDSVFWRKWIQPVLEDRHLILERLTSDAVDCLEAAWYACEEERPCYELEVRHALSQLIAALGPSEQGQKGHWNVQNVERMKLMLSFIQYHLSEPLTVGQIAEAASISESECIRCFKKAIFDTPIHYLRKLRIQRAAELIAGGGMRATQAAEACGFHDLSYFTRCFRQQMGMTPGEYRRRWSNQKRI